MNLRAVAPLLAVALGAVLAFSPSVWADGVLPFTTYQAEKQSVLNQLPCKWVSVGGRDGIRRDDAKYDFLCKGGNWATVSLMLDEAGGLKDGVGRVRLLFREWPAEVHPGGGEAYVAQQFLQHVVDRFVPADLGAGVMESFWAKRKRMWRGDGVKVAFETEDFGNHVVRRLEIVGLARALGGQKIMAEPVATPKTEQQGGGLLNGMKGLVEAVTPAPVAPAPVAEQPVVAPQPEVLKFSAAPAPESLVSDTAPSKVSDELVPNAEDVVRGRASAPSTFDAYNKAEELTRQYELRALPDPNANPKVTAPETAGEATGLLVAPEPNQPTGPNLPAVPTPGVAVPLPVVVSGTVITPTDAGLAKPGKVADAEAPARVDNAVSVPAEDPRFVPDRMLPQLKYIPKARPVDEPNKVIEFEDEKSAL